MDVFLVVLFRWLHVIAACLTVGGAFFMGVVLPRGLSAVDSPEARHAAFVRCRRGFKMTVHPCILVLLLSGIYNLIRNRHAYHQTLPLSHAMLGLHALVALAVFTIAIIVLMGREPPSWHRRAMAINLVLLALVVAAGSTLKWVREHPQSPQQVNQPG
jgi:uncharacterized membrane protein